MSRRQMSTDELAARTIRGLARTADPHWQDYYHSSLDLLAERTVRKLTNMQVSLNRAADAEARFEVASERHETSELLRAMLDTSTHLAALRPILQDLGELVAQLKETLKFLADAEELQSSTAQREAEKQAVTYVVQLLDRLAEVPPSTLESTIGVVELVLETGVMLSSRASCADAFRETGGLEMIVHLLDVQDYSLMLERGSIILAHLAEGALNRYHLRLEGAVPVLVSLLQSPMPDGTRIAAATAISIMCCRDGPCQDALRLSDGLKYLVRMCNSPEPRVAEVAKLALDCASEENAKNASAVMRALRMEQTLSGTDFRRATALLSETSGLLNEETYSRYAPASPGTSRPYTAPSRRASTSPRAQQRSVKSPEATLRQVLEFKSPRSTFGRPMESPSAYTTPGHPARQWTSARTPPTRRYHAESETTLSPRQGSPTRRTMDILQSSLHPTKGRGGYPRSEVSELSDASEDDLESPPSARRPASVPIRRPPGSPTISALRHMSSCKPPSLLSPSELCDLVMEMGCPGHEAEMIVEGKLSGEKILDMDQHDLRKQLRHGGEIVRILGVIQRASEMFDRMTRSRMQGKMSELECRVFLATQGLRGGEVSEVAEKFREIDHGSDGCVSFWEFAKAYEWFSRVLKEADVTDVP